MTVWTLPGTLVRVIDGDTIVADLDLGFGIIRKKTSVRIEGVNSPELATPEGIAARAWLTTYLRGDGMHEVNVTVLSRKLDKYGRVLGEVMFGPGALSAAVVAAGHATWA